MRETKRYLYLSIIALCAGYLSKPAFAPELFYGPMVNLFLLRQTDASTPEDEKPYQKIFNKAVCPVFPSSRQATGGRIYWGESDDPDIASLIGRGQLIPLRPRQSRYLHKLVRMYTDNGVEDTEYIAMKFPFPRQVPDLFGRAYKESVQFADPDAGLATADWVGFRVLEKTTSSGKTERRIALVFRYFDPRAENGVGLIPIDFDTRYVITEPFDYPNTSKEEESRFGIDSGQGVRAVRAVAAHQDRTNVWVVFEKDAEEVRKARKGVIRMYAVPLWLLRSPSPGRFEQRQAQYHDWASQAVNREDEKFVGRPKYVIPISVEREFSPSAFHRYLVGEAHKSLQQFHTRYTNFVALQNCGRVVSSALYWGGHGFYNLVTLGGLLGPKSKNRNQESKNRPER